MFMHLWDELTRSGDHNGAHTEMIEGDNSAAATTSELFVPLQFFCCRNDGLALPLIALQYHDVRLEFEFESSANCGVADATATAVAAVDRGRRRRER